MLTCLEVIFEGTTTFGYEEWDGPLVSVSGTDITVTGATGAVLDGDGSRWWDSEGSNGGKTKPKFFYAHNLLGTSSINNIYIENSPVQVFSIDDSTGLTITDATIDNTDGDDNGAANTDCFDVGDSTSITISGANCYNQDVSATHLRMHDVQLQFVDYLIPGLPRHQLRHRHHFHRRRLLRRPWPLHRLRRWPHRQHGQNRPH